MFLWVTFANNKVLAFFSPNCPFDQNRRHLASMAMTRTLLFAVYVIGVGAQTRADSSVPSSAEAVGILRPKDFGIEFNDNIAGSNVPEEATTSKGSVKGTMSEGVMTAAANTDRRSGALLQREAKLSKAAASSMRKRGAQAGGALMMNAFVSSKFSPVGYV